MKITSGVVFVVQVLKRLRLGRLDLVTGEGQPGVEGLVRVKRHREGVVLNSDQALGGHRHRTKSVRHLSKGSTQQSVHPLSSFHIALHSCFITFHPQLSTILLSCIGAWTCFSLVSAFPLSTCTSCPAVVRAKMSSPALSLALCTGMGSKGALGLLSVAGSCCD